MKWKYLAMENYRKNLAVTLVVGSLLSGCFSLTKAPATISVLDIDKDTPLHILSVIHDGKSESGAIEPKSGNWFSIALSRKSTKAKKAEDEANSPLQAAVENVDLGQLMVYELNGAFRKSKPFDVQNIHGVSYTVKDITEQLNNVPEPAMLFLQTDYRWVSTTNVLVVETEAQLYLRPKETDLKKKNTKASPIYTNRIESQIDLSGVSQSQWASDAADGLRLALKEIAQLVAIDLRVAKQWETLSEKQTWTAADTGKRLKGYQVFNDNGRITVRLKNGELVSLPHG